MNALILAAGTGSRLVKLTRDLPKALVEVQGRPLIDYALKFVESIRCAQIFVVGGFYFEKLEAYLGRCAEGVTLIENKEFLKGSILTLNSALPQIDDSFLLLNVDHIFPFRLGKKFLQTRDHIRQITTFVDFDRPLQEDDMKVLLSEDQKIKRISKGLHDFDAGYTGLTYVPSQKLPAYKEAASDLQNEDEDAVVENVLQKLIEQDQQLSIFDMSGVRWLEIDNQCDLKNAERILRWVEGFLD